MAKFRYETTTLDFTTGIGAPSFPAQEGLSLHSYITNKPFYTITNRQHGTTAINWTTNGAQKTLRDTIYDFWNTTLTEGYSDFTVIDHRLRMLFEASWNDWQERWSKRRGGIFDVIYQIESPIPWTPPTFGIFPMVTAGLINHNLSGDDLATTDGEFVTNATDSSVLRLNGNALKLEGDGSSSGLLGASGTVEWKRTTKHNHITLFCQFMADATLSTGDLAILETTHSSNVFRLELKSSTGGELTHLQNNNTGGLVQDVDVDVANTILFVADITSGIRSFKYTSLGVSTLVSSISGGQTLGVGVDTTNKIAFQANGNLGVKSYTYVNAGTLAFSNNQTPGGTCYDVAVDYTRKIAFAVITPSALFTYTYTTGGVMTPVDSDAVGSGHGLSVAVDATNSLVFVTDTVDGVYTYKYDAAGNLAYVDKKDPGGSVSAIAIDASRKIAFVASDSGGGFFTYTYTSAGVLAVGETGITTDCVGVGVDTVNKVVSYAAGSAGVYTNSYDTSGNLTPIDNNDQGGSALESVLDSTNTIMFLANDNNGFESYSYTMVANQLFGKIVNNADNTEVRKGASAYHELTNGTWYDLGFTYNAITKKSYLYFAASGDNSFTEFLSGETDITEGIGEYGNADCTVQDIPWTACNILKELTNDVVADGSNVYVQNAMIFNGVISSHEFNTCRRLSYLWAKKTTTYPK